MRCDKGLLNYNLAYQTLEHLTVARVVHYLAYIFDCGAHEIFTNIDHSQLFEATTPINLATSPLLSDCLASHVKIWFWGGPPGDASWYKGTLLTMLIDILFYCVIMDYEDTVHKFLETLNDTSTASHDKTRQATPPPASYM